MGKMMTQLELLKKYVMALPMIAVDAVESKYYKNEKEAKKLDKDWYLANYSGGSHPAHQRKCGN